MIRLNALTPQETAILSRTPSDSILRQLLGQRRMAYAYNHTEFTQLSQSPLLHDLFLNHIGPDTQGQKIQLPFAEENISEALWIQNSQLAFILQPFDTIRKASWNLGPPASNIESLLLEFIRLCQAQDLDLISMSDLKWSYGD